MILQDKRTELDAIDAQIVDLMARRMGIIKEIGHFKAENKMPILDSERERQKLADLAKQAGPELAPITDALFSVILDLSRSAQNQIVAGESPIKNMIKKAIAATPTQFPTRPLVACQGVEGAYSQLAADRIFPSGSIMYFNTFDGVFAAVEQNLCQYGILPLENSTAGSVNRIYDLMMERHCYIVRSSRIKIDHCLLVNPGTKLSDIREIVSMEQAIAQSQHFLKDLKNVKVTPCANTAAASKLVRESGRNDIAALSSRSCAELYGLECLRESVQDQGNNYTRFICISKNLEIYPGANRTSMMMVLPNRKGSLYRILSRFNALGINLIKLESRPLANSDFEFMFYFDLDVSVYSDEFLRIFDDLTGAVAELKYLGSYTEVI
ncbi:MAG TPA: prephenate dehydratase domain-containing protein [Oscillospiraceae bacterium]|nr:prephenate dehydratase domain-containing protein [Oscillospiraceae bacterium]HPF56795.1 prephenate dehydratase domain-containing protein [Clostridiales bacterium]HPK35971.1 prephenate dehydratase domain-containing protein [Oscillospiraceae bacterium]